MENLNPFDRFKHIYTLPGIMVYSLIEVNGTQEFAFCIKEEMQYINRYKHMTIEVILGMLKINNVLIVPMMLRRASRKIINSFFKAPIFLLTMFISFLSI